MNEKRSLPRINVVAHYKITESDSELDRGRVTDISTEGMRLQGPLPFEVNSTAAFEMAVPLEDSTTDNILFDANVIWSRESETPGMYDSGIRLWNISPGDCEYLQHLVETIPTGQEQLEALLDRPFKY